MADKTPFTEIRIRAGDTDRSATWYMRQVQNYARHLTNPNELYQSDLVKLLEDVFPDLDSVSYEGNESTQGIKFYCPCSKALANQIQRRNCHYNVFCF